MCLFWTVSCRCVDIHLQWEGMRREGRRDKGDKDADRWRGGILSSPPRFIFSEAHWGPATRLSPACRNTALCGIFLSASPFHRSFSFCCKISEISFFFPSSPFLSSSSLPSSLILRPLFLSLYCFIYIQLLSPGWRCNHPLPRTKMKTEMNAAFRMLLQTLKHTRTTPEYRWVGEIFAMIPEICRDAAWKRCQKSVQQLLFNLARSHTHTQRPCSRLDTQSSFLLLDFEINRIHLKLRNRSLKGNSTKAESCTPSTLQYVAQLHVHTFTVWPAF